MKLATSFMAAATLLTTTLGAPTKIAARDTQLTWTITDFTISSMFPSKLSHLPPNTIQTTPTTYPQNTTSIS
jgi:hypothetical protein